jgi:cytochrome bd-type quinol oxidase subunit 2
MERMPDPVDQAVAHARAKAARTLPVFVAMLLAVVAMSLPLPRRFVAVVPLVLVVVLTVRLLRFLTDRKGSEKVVPAMTLVVAGVLLATLGLQGLFYPQVRDYEACVVGAQTSEALAACEQLRDGVFWGARELG